MKKLLLLLIGVTLISCQKDDDITNTYESNSGIGFELKDNFNVIPPAKSNGKTVVWNHAFGINKHTLSIDRSSTNENYSDTYDAGSISTLAKGTTGIRLSYGKWIASSFEINAPTSGLTNYRIYEAKSLSTSVNTAGGIFSLTIQDKQGLLLLPTSAGTVSSGNYAFHIKDGYSYAYAFPGDHVITIDGNTFTISVEAGVQYDLSESNEVELSEPNGDGWYEVAAIDYGRDYYIYTGVHINNSVIDSTFYSGEDAFFDAEFVNLQRNYNSPHTSSSNTGIGFTFEFLSYDNNSGKGLFNVSYNGISTSNIELIRRDKVRSRELYDQRVADFAAIPLYNRLSNLVIDVSTINSYRSGEAPIGITIPELPDAYITESRDINEYVLDDSCYIKTNFDWNLSNSSGTYLNYVDNNNGDHDLTFQLRGTYIDYTVQVYERFYGRRTQVQNQGTANEYTYTYPDQHSFSQANYIEETVIECP